MLEPLARQHGTVPINVVHSLQQELSTVRRSLIELQSEIHQASPNVSISTSAVRRSLSPPASARSPSKALLTIDRLLAIQDGRAVPSPERTSPGRPSVGAGAGAYHGSGLSAREDAPRRRPPPSPSPSPTRPAAEDAPKRHPPGASASKVSFGLDRAGPSKRSPPPRLDGSGYAYEPGLVDLVDQLESPVRGGRSNYR